MQINFGVACVERQVEFELKAFRNDVVFTANLEKSQMMLVPG